MPNSGSARKFEQFLKHASKYGHVKLAFYFCFLCIILAFLRIHLRLKTTMIGYEVGRLQSKEIELIQKKSLLDMQLSVISQKEHLLQIANQHSSSQTKDAF